MLANHPSDRPLRKILFLWSRPNGYMASCWRALNSLEGINVQIVAIEKFKNDPSAPDFGTSILDSLQNKLISKEQADSYPFVSAQVEESCPDVIAVSGWSHAGYRQLLLSSQYRHLPVILCVDNPWRGDFRQRLGYWKARKFLNRAKIISVPGKRSRELMRFWRVPNEKIADGMYGFDARIFDIGGRIQRKSKAWPRRFLYVGRMDHRKGVDLLLDAYIQYRNRTSNPWELHCYGRGPLLESARMTPGTYCQDFVAPDQLGEVMVGAGGFLLPSRFDAWGVVVAEAMGAGLPVICSDGCGAVDDLVVHGKNGLVVRANNVLDIVESMLEFDAKGSALLDWGVEARKSSEYFVSANWAQRWAKLIHQLPVSGAL